MVTVLHESGLR